MASRSGATRGATTPCASLVPGTLVSVDESSGDSEVVVAVPELVAVARGRKLA